MNLKIKIVCGYRKDQEHTVDIDEAHKAYYLFFNPDKRVIFRNGLAIRGEQIHSILPDYINTMGWNPTHALSDDDWNELTSNGVDRQLKNAMAFAKSVAQIGTPDDLRLPLTALKQKHKALLPGSGMARIYEQGASIGALLTQGPSVDKPI